MNWNKSSDNDEGLPDIDIDSREIIKPKTVKPEKKRKISPEARLIFDLFGPSCYARIHIRKQETEAAEWLAETHDLETLKKAVAYTRSHSDDEFCPRVFSPYDLRTKWANLVEYKKKHG